VNRQSLLGPKDPSFRALSERLKFTVRRHKFSIDSLSRKSQFRSQAHVHDLAKEQAGVHHQKSEVG